MTGLKVGEVARQAGVNLQTIHYSFARAEAKLHDNDGKVPTLQAMRVALTRLIGECAGQGPVTRCPILEALDWRGSE